VAGPENNVSIWINTSTQFLRLVTLNNRSSRNTRSSKNHCVPL